jgi:TRAP-type mannitol/chloroaromatic compound transport system substrate-binding protein
MKRRDFLKAGGCRPRRERGGRARDRAVDAGSEVAPGRELAASWPKALDTLYGGCEFFCKRVAEVTDNRFQIQPFAAGEIVPGLQVLDAVSNGTVEMGNTALLLLLGQESRFHFRHVACRSASTRASIFPGWKWGGGTEMLNDLVEGI